MYFKPYFESPNSQWRKFKSSFESLSTNREIANGVVKFKDRSKIHIGNGDANTGKYSDLYDILYI